LDFEGYSFAEVPLLSGMWQLFQLDYLSKEISCRRNGYKEKLINLYYVTDLLLLKTVIFQYNVQQCNNIIEEN
jgi:hypothetical protein